jgi:type II secretory pathway pseudopilin PulG
LIEIMVVVAILGIVLATGMPSILQSLQKEDFRQGISDMVEALTRARAQAILEGIPAQMVLRPEDGAIFVERAGGVADGTDVVGEVPPAPVAGGSSAPGGAEFKAHLHPDILITLVYVNLTDQMQADAARVQFFPNGTCDDFTVVMEFRSSVRKISTDPITGSVEVQTIR